MATRSKAAPAQLQVSVDEEGNVIREGQAWTGTRPDSDDNDESGAAEIEVYEESAVDRVLTVLDETADKSRRTKISLWRIRQDTGEKGFCEDFTAQQIEAGGFPMLRRKWGSGHYELRVYGYKPGQSRFVVLSRPEFTLEADPGDNTPPPVAVQHQSDVTAVLRTLAEGQQQMLAALTNRPAVDPFAGMESMLKMMVLMKQVNVGSVQSPISEVIKAVRDIKGVSELLGGGGEKSELSELAGLAAPLVQMIAQQQQPRQPVVMQAPVLRLPSQFGVNQNAARQVNTRVPATAEAQVGPSENVAPAPIKAPLAASALEPGQQVVSDETADAAASDDNVQEAPASDGEDQARAALTALLDKLVSMAGVNAPVDESAEFVYEQIPDELLELLLTNMWWMFLSQAAPQVIPHEAWLRKVRDAVVAIEAEEAAQEESNPAG
jgi:hypothetical protein